MEPAMRVTLQYGRGRPKVVKSLLGEWISSKLEVFRPPPRGRRVAGVEVPFSADKMIAALLMLTNFSMGRIARHAQTSIGVIKVWRTEPRFREAIEAYREEFAAFWVKQWTDQWTDHVTHSKPVPPSDVAFYNALTVRAILDHIRRWSQPDPIVTQLNRAGMVLSVSAAAGDPELRSPATLRALAHAAVCRAALSGIQLGTTEGLRLAANMLEQLLQQLERDAAAELTPGPRQPRPLSRRRVT